jgi:putative transposase
MTEVIHLSDEDCGYLKEFVKKGEKKARMIARANVLILANEGYDNDTISKLVNVHRQSIWRTKKRYLSEGLQSALEEKPRPGQPRKYTDKHETEIIALACTAPPKGRNQWSLALLAETLRRKKGFKTINRESIRLVLKKPKPNPG